ncbi:MAG: diaminopimelate decarboxylase [Methanoregula sp.]|nr:diaminopimelate decarboxylase [Methanoregula sp.]
MKLPHHLTIKDHHLCIGGHDCVRLVQEYGTPLYVTSEDRVCEQFLHYKEALSHQYPKVQVLFAAKANGNLALMRVLAQLGAGADVFSAGELHLALEAGMRPEKLLFNGSSKTPADLKLAVEKGVKISVDSLDELHQLDAIARAAGTIAKIGFRVNPALEVPTHPKIATGLATSKFGIPHEKIPAAYAEALACKNVKPVGIHCHIGSQILDVEPFVRAAEVMVRIAKELTHMGVQLEFVDLGGGLGIPYHHDTDPAPTPEDYAKKVVPVFKAGMAACGITPELWVEPGRFLVADSTVLLTRVNSTKMTHKSFANVDAGFNLLIRPAMYDSYHEVIVAGNADAATTTECTVTGPICETGDILAPDRKLPKFALGDILAVLDTGAYGYAMSSQYNSRPRCPELLIKGSQVALMRRGETIADITGTMLRPPWQR